MQQNQRSAHREHPGFYHSKDGVFSDWNAVAAFPFAEKPNRRAAMFSVFNFSAHCPHPEADVCLVVHCPAPDRNLRSSDKETRLTFLPTLSCRSGQLPAAARGPGLRLPVRLRRGHVPQVGVRERARPRQCPPWAQRSTLRGLRLTAPLLSPACTHALGCPPTAVLARGFRTRREPAGLWPLRSGVQVAPAMLVEHIPASAGRVQRGGWGADAVTLPAESRSTSCACGRGRATHLLWTSVSPLHSGAHRLAVGIK